MLVPELILIAILGAMAGSFVNAWVWRIRNDESIVKGRSHCPHCNHTLGVRDLIPVVSWLSLRGRCRYCQESIGVNYLFVEIIAVVLFSLSFAAWNVQLPLSLLMLGIWLVCATLLLVVAVYDQKWMEIPLIPLAIVAVLVFIFQIVSVSQGFMSWNDFAWKVVAATFFSGLFWLISTVPKSKKMLGEGDAYVVAVMGLLLGFIGTIVAVSIASYIGVAVALPQLIKKGRSQLKQTVAFGPLLLSGLFITFLYGEWLIELIIGYAVTGQVNPY